MSKQILYAASWLINSDAPPLSGGALLVENGIITAVGELKDLRNSSWAELIEFPDCAIVPGFVNAHTHLELTYYPAWLSHSAVNYSPRRFVDWIVQLIKVKRFLTAAEYTASIREGLRMCLESGTTAIGEIITDHTLAGCYGQNVISGRLFFELLGHSASFFSARMTSFEDAVSLVDGYLLPGMSPHSPYTLAAEFFQDIATVAGNRSLPMSIHLAESSAECDFIRNGNGDLVSELFQFVGWQEYAGRSHGCSSTELLDRHGLLTPDTALIHCVHVSSSDADIIKSRGSRIVLCPRSNDLLDVGRAPVAMFKKLAIPLALGTDSLASNNSLSMWDEMRFALQIFSDELNESDVLRMATTGGASAIGMSSLCGELAVGRRADFQVVLSSNSTADTVVKRLVLDGRVQDVFVNGSRYIGDR